MRVGTGRRGERKVTDLVLNPLGEEVKGDLGLVVGDHVSSVIDLMIGAGDEQERREERRRGPGRRGGRGKGRGRRGQEQVSGELERQVQLLSVTEDSPGGK